MNDNKDFNFDNNNLKELNLNLKLCRESLKIKEDGLSDLIRKSKKWEDERIELCRQLDSYRELNNLTNQKFETFKKISEEFKQKQLDETKVLHEVCDNLKKSESSVREQLEKTNRDLNHVIIKMNHDSESAILRFSKELSERQDQMAELLIELERTKNSSDMIINNLRNKLEINESILIKFIKEVNVSDLDQNDGEYLKCILNINNLYDLSLIDDENNVNNSNSNPSSCKILKPTNFKEIFKIISQLQNSLLEKELKNLNQETEIKYLKSKKQRNNSNNISDNKNKIIIENMAESKKLNEIDKIINEKNDILLNSEKKLHCLQEMYDKKISSLEKEINIKDEEIQIFKENVNEQFNDNKNKVKLIINQMKENCEQSLIDRENLMKIKLKNLETDKNIEKLKEIKAIRNEMKNQYLNKNIELTNKLTEEFKLTEHELRLKIKEQNDIIEKLKNVGSLKLSDLKIKPEKCTNNILGSTNEFQITGAILHDNNNLKSDELSCLESKSKIEFSKNNDDIEMVDDKKLKFEELLKISLEKNFDNILWSSKNLNEHSNSSINLIDKYANSENNNKFANHLMENEEKCNLKIMNSSEVLSNINPLDINFNSNNSYNSKNNSISCLHSKELSKINDDDDDELILSNYEEIDSRIPSCQTESVNILQNNNQTVNLLTSSELMFFESFGSESINEDLFTNVSNVIPSQNLKSNGFTSNIVQPAELEFLKSVLYKYMLGFETRTLARVICSVMKYEENEVEKVMKRHERI